MIDILKIIQSFKTKKNTIFLLFVLGTSIFWFINKLSNDYWQLTPLEVEYIDLPSKFIFQEQAPTTISVRIKASGFYLFKQALNTKQINISLKNIKQIDKYNYYLSNDRVLKQVKNQFKKKIEVDDVLEDRLEFKLGKRSYKKVPVLADIQVDYLLGYNSFKGVRVLPDSIVVSGPEMQLSKVDSILLKPLVRLDVNNSIKEKIKIIKPNIPKLEYNKDEVEVYLKVEKITEKTITVPIKLVNTSIEEVVVFPKKIKVSFQVSLADFNKINAHNFSLVCDYNTKGEKFMDVKLVKQPQNISKLKLYNNKVEYLILK